MRFILSYWKFENGQWTKVQKTLITKTKLKVRFPNGVGLDYGNYDDSIENLQIIVRDCLPKDTLLDAVTLIKAAERKK